MFTETYKYCNHYIKIFIRYLTFIIYSSLFYIYYIFYYIDNLLVQTTKIKYGVIIYL